MSAMETATAPAPPPGRADAKPSRIIGAMLARDARVILRRQWFTYLSRVLAQPLLLLFVFSYVLPSTHGAELADSGAFGTVMAPGIVAATMVYAGVMGVTIPLVTQLTYPREIEDRLLSPVPVWGLAVHRIVSGAAQSLLAALLVFPALLFLHAPGAALDLRVDDWPLFLTVLVLSALVSSCLGLLMGTLLDPTHMNLLFTVIMMPALMLGCVYYPWAALSHIRWLQIAVLVNPIVYLSEAFRAVLTPAASSSPEGCP
jgi:ABC-2 type transport system permease protein